MINENYELNEKQVQQYLEKIGMNYPLQPTIENLKELQCNHLSIIPYENLNILYGIPISLDGDDLFDKIIIQNRGGFCFELNGLYQWLLKALGYKVTSYHTRLLAVDPEEQLLRHRMLKVDFDKVSYITDVGIRSESPRYPLELKPDIIQTDGISDYRYLLDDTQGWIFQQKRPEKEWNSIFAFDTIGLFEKDFVMPSFFCEKHPDSPFTKGAQMSIFPKGKHITIAHQTLIISEGNTIVEKRELSPHEFKDACRQYFLIDLDTIQATQ